MSSEVDQGNNDLFLDRDACHTALSNKRNANHVVEILQLMNSNSLLKPGGDTYTRAIGSLLDAGLVDEAYKIYPDLKAGWPGKETNAVMTRIFHAFEHGFEASDDGRDDDSEYDQDLNVADMHMSVDQISSVHT